MINYPKEKNSIEERRQDNKKGAGVGQRILRSTFFKSRGYFSEVISWKNFKRKPPLDDIIYFLALTLLSIGAIMIVSASYGASRVYSVSTLYFAFKHFLSCAMAIMLLRFFGRNKELVKPVGTILWWLSLLGLIGVMFFGSTIKGARRWINVFGFSLQPSEFSKVAVVLEGARFLGEWPRFFMIYFVQLIFILLQPDLGSAIIILFLAITQVITKKFNFKYLLLSFFGIVALLFFAYEVFPHVRTRIDLFFKPGDILGKGYQQHKAFLAMQNGGWLGLGFGKGIIKDLLPDAHTDFIFAVIVEEFGILGGLGVIAVFIALGLRVLSLVVRDTYFKLIQYSLLVLILSQAWLNIASTVGLIPSKGLALPLISYGGSGLLANGIVFGMLMAVSFQKKPTK